MTSDEKTLWCAIVASHVTGITQPRAREAVLREACKDADHWVLALRQMSQCDSDFQGEPTPHQTIELHSNKELFTDGPIKVSK